MKKNISNIGNLLILALGVILVFVSKTPFFENLPILSKTIETLGITLAGYGPIGMFINFYESLRDRSIKGKIEKLFESSIKVISRKKKVLFFAVDISGCITPVDRSEISLIDLQRLRSYCEFVMKNPEYPTIVFYTGRSQGYLEILLQTLNMLGYPFTFPHIIENGTALYSGIDKKVIPLINQDEISTIRLVNTIIQSTMTNKLEPKSYMVTVNPNDNETVEELREKISNLLIQKELRESVHISSTYSAVDITPKGRTKISALMDLLSSQGYSSTDLRDIVSVGDQTSDFDILKSTGRAYCPSEKVHHEVREYIENKFGLSNVINASEINIVIKVIEIECGIKII